MLKYLLYRGDLPQDPHLFHVEAVSLMFGGSYPQGLVTNRGVAGSTNDAIVVTCLKGWGRCHNVSR